MSREQIMAEVRDAFAGLPRPRMFIGDCRCPECLEHEKTMQSFTPGGLPLDKLGCPEWDPIAFTSYEAFAYLMPGLVRVALEHPDDYVEQFVSHLQDWDRVAVFSFNHAKAMLHVLDFLVLEHPEDLDNNYAVDDLFRAREKLEQHRECRAWRGSM